MEVASHMIGEPLDVEEKKEQKKTSVYG